MKYEKIKATCPRCGYETTYESDNGSKPGKCPRCKESFTDKRGTNAKP